MTTIYKFTVAFPLYTPFIGSIAPIAAQLKIFDSSVKKKKQNNTAFFCIINLITKKKPKNFIQKSKIDFLK